MSNKILILALVVVLIAIVTTTYITLKQGEEVDTEQVEGLSVEPSKDVIITTDKTEYKQGEIVKITITNNLKESIYSQIGGNTPVFGIEYIERKRLNGTWEKLFAQCRYPHCIYKIAPAQEIKPGQSETFEWKPLIFINGTSETKQAGPGRYRLLISYLDYQKTEWRSVYSNEFIIK